MGIFMRVANNIFGSIGALLATLLLPKQALSQEA